MGRAIAFVLVVGILFVTSVAAGTTAAGGWLWAALLLSGVVAVAIGVRRCEPGSARPWWLIAAGLSALALGTIIDPSLGEAPASEPVAAIAGGFFLIGFPLIALAAARFARAQSGGRDNGPVLDGAILTIAFTAVVSESAFARHGWATSADVQELVQTVLMAAGTSWTLAMSVRQFLAGGHRAMSGRTVLASSALSFAGAAVLAWSGFDGGAPLITLACWAGAVALLGISALDPSMRHLTEPSDVETSHVPTRSLLLGAALLAPPTAILTRLATDGELAVVAVASSALIAPMVVMRFFGLLREADRAHREAEFQMLHDPLTQLPNRRLLGERLDQALRRRQQAGHHVAVLFLDLNGFKAINDAHGHAVGDQLLVEAARRLAGTCRAGDTVARFAGDEFVVVLEDVTRQQAVETAERLHQALGEPAMIGANRVTVGASLGIALSGELGDEPEVLMSAADVAMYTAKQRPDRYVEIAPAPDTDADPRPTSAHT